MLSHQRNWIIHFLACVYEEITTSLQEKSLSQPRNLITCRSPCRLESQSQSVVPENTNTSVLYKYREDGKLWWKMNLTFEMLECWVESWHSPPVVVITAFNSSTFLLYFPFFQENLNLTWKAERDFLCYHNSGLPVNNPNWIFPLISNTRGTCCLLSINQEILN